MYKCSISAFSTSDFGGGKHSTTTTPITAMVPSMHFIAKNNTYMTDGAMNLPKNFGDDSICVNNDDVTYTIPNVAIVFKPAKINPIRRSERACSNITFSLSKLMSYAVQMYFPSSTSQK
jgi:hypothetical protein